MFLVTGIGVAPGIAEGRALVVRTRRRDVRYLVAADRVRAELSRLTEAQGRSRRQLEGIRAKLAGVAGQGAASLFEAQLLMIDDAMLVGRAAAFVRDERRNAEWALRAAADELVAVIGAAGDPYLRERHGDVRDVVERLVGNLRWESRGIVVPEGSEPWVLVADELAPSTVAQVDWSRAAGFVTEGGSWASHTAILARSLGVPAVVGVARATTAIPPGASVDLDGTTGECLINGDASTRADWHRRTVDAPPVVRWERAGAGAFAGPARTLDGIDIRLDANLERPDELADVLASGATPHRPVPLREPARARRPRPGRSDAVRDLSAHPGGDAGRGHDPHLRRRARAGRPPSRPAHAAGRSGAPRPVRGADSRAAGVGQRRPAAHPAAVRHRRRRPALRPRRDRRAPPRRSVTPASRSRRCPSAPWSKCRPRR